MNLEDLKYCELGYTVHDWTGFDQELNDLTREKINEAYAEWGQCWLGNINRHEEDEGKPYLFYYVYILLYQDQIKPFQFGFILPRYDDKLVNLIIERQKSPNTKTLKKIMDRVEEIGGRHLLWAQ